MKNLNRIYFLSAILFFLTAVSMLPLYLVGAQENPYTYLSIGNVLRAEKLPPGINTKAELIRELIKNIKKRTVDKPLTPDREDDLRQAGSNLQKALLEEVIETVRQNSPKLPGQIETPTPITVSSPVATTTQSQISTVSTNPDPKKTFDPKPIKNSLGMEFNLIPAGTFTMGSPLTEEGREINEVPHKVAISRDFYMSVYEVTQGQWKTVMGTNPSFFARCGDDCPVENISWNDTQEFIRKLNSMGMGTYRLPTEAEWEYAARGGKESEPFGIGEGKVLTSDLANFRGSYPYGSNQIGDVLEKTVPVGKYQPNAWGLHDMHGNVREWCSDWYAEYNTANKVRIDQGGPVVGGEKIIRGGGFISGGKGSRSAYRQRLMSLNDRRDNVGLRLVKVD